MTTVSPAGAPELARTGERTARRSTLAWLRRMLVGVGVRWTWHRLTSWHRTPIPVMLYSLRYHRRMYNPWSQDFTQKLLRYIRSDWIEQQFAVADKIAVRQLVEDRIGPGYLTELYAVADTFEGIDLSLLPEQFYVKTNHGCGYNVPCPRKSELDVADCRRKVRDFLANDFFIVAGERQYRRIERKVFVEEYLDMTRPRAMMLRLFAFEGDVAFILVDTASDRRSPHACGFYLPDWTRAPFRLGADEPDADVPRPHNLAEVLQIGSTLSKGMPFVRVDLYWLDGRIVFSELTLTPSAGRRRVAPTSYDRELGRKFVLPSSSRHGG
jgi:hypothetical protein